MTTKSIGDCQVIKHPKSRVIVIREDYLAICDENACMAAILSYVECLHRWKAKHDDSAWIYKDQDELRREMLNVYSERPIRRALGNLVAKGFLALRRNSQNKFDRTYQYAFQVEAVQAAVDQWGAEQKAESDQKTSRKAVSPKAQIGGIESAEVRIPSGDSAPSIYKTLESIDSIDQRHSSKTQSIAPQADASSGDEISFGGNVDLPKTTEGDRAKDDRSGDAPGIQTPPVAPPPPVKEKKPAKNEVFLKAVAAELVAPGVAWESIQADDRIFRWNKLCADRIMNYELRKTGQDSLTPQQYEKLAQEVPRFAKWFDAAYAGAIRPSDKAAMKWMTWDGLGKPEASEGNNGNQVSASVGKFTKNPPAANERPPQFPVIGADGSLPPVWGNGAKRSLPPSQRSGHEGDS